MNSIDDYQDFTHTTAMYRKPLEHVDEQIMYCMLGLTGETGEVAEKLKKKLRGGGSLSEFHHDPVIAKELGTLLGIGCSCAASLDTQHQPFSK